MVFIKKIWLLPDEIKLSYIRIKTYDYWSLLLSWLICEEFQHSIKDSHKRTRHQLLSSLIALYCTTIQINDSAWPRKSVEKLWCIWNSVGLYTSIASSGEAAKDRKRKNPKNDNNFELPNCQTDAKSSIQKTPSNFFLIVLTDFLFPDSREWT